MDLIIDMISLKSEAALNNSLLLIILGIATVEIDKI